MKTQNVNVFVYMKIASAAAANSNINWYSNECVFKKVIKAITSANSGLIKILNETKKGSHTEKKYAKLKQIY